MQGVVLRSGKDLESGSWLKEEKKETGERRMEKQTA